MVEVKAKRLSSLSGKLADQIFEIYCASFPCAERLAFPYIKRSAAKGERFVFLAEIANDAVGFALVKPLSCEDIYLLEYIAVTQKMRSQGIGSYLLRYTTENVLYHEKARGILLEVEPAERGPEGERGVRRRRIQFYLRNGAYIVKQLPSYRVPDLSGSGTLDMKLMWLPLDKTRKAISDRKLKDCVVSIFAGTYGRSEDDPILQSILEDLTF